MLKDLNYENSTNIFLTMRYSTDYNRNSIKKLFQR